MARGDADPDPTPEYLARPRVRTDVSEERAVHRTTEGEATKVMFKSDSCAIARVASMLVSWLASGPP